MLNPLDWDLGNVPPGVAWGGMDEAGRGAWAGPVVAACAVLDPDTVRKWGHVLRAMRQCVEGLALRPRILFIDGNRAPRTGLPERLVVDGDALSCAIGAASILAKAHRDAHMIGLEELHPGYGFGQHKGYGTALHRAQIEALGVSPVHRLSYAPVAALQKVDEALRDALHKSLDRCSTVADRQAWVATELRPAYGSLKLVWVETLRRRYADRLVQVADAGTEAPE